MSSTERCWATVRIEQVDEDGQVHFVEVPDGLEVSRASTATSTVPPDTEQAGSGFSGTTAEQKSAQRTIGDPPGRAVFGFDALITRRSGRSS